MILFKLSIVSIIYNKAFNSKIDLVLVELPTLLIPCF